MHASNRALACIQALDEGCALLVHASQHGHHLHMHYILNTTTMHDSYAGSKKETLDRRLSWLPSFGTTFSLSSQPSTGQELFASSVESSLARLQSASQASTLPSSTSLPPVERPSTGSDHAPLPGAGMLPAIHEDSSFAFAQQAQAAPSSENLDAHPPVNQALPWSAWVDSGDVPASPVSPGADNLAAVAFGSVLLRSSEGEEGFRDSTGDTQPRKWYLGPGTGLFASEQVGSAAGAESNDLSLPSESSGGAAVTGLMLQQVVSRSLSGHPQHLHSVPGDGDSTEEAVVVERSLDI